jgi:hypothetical protein
MIITNLTDVDYWFGPMRLPGGSGQTLYLDDTSDTSLYLLSDEVADAVNTLLLSSNITVSSAAAPFPRPTGTPSLLHGDGSPEGLVYAPQGSLYMRRDSTLASTSLYTKTTGVTVNTGWISVVTPGMQFINEVTVTEATQELPITFGSIPQYFSHLKLIGSMGGSASGVWPDLCLTVNNPPPPAPLAYYYQQTSSFFNDIVPGTLPNMPNANFGPLPQLGYMGNVEITLMGYTNATMVPFSSVVGAFDYSLQQSVFITGQMQTSELGGAITSITLEADAGESTFAVGSVVTLYGLAGNVS